MQQLSEMDSNFLQQESASTPMHISPVIVYEQPGGKGGKVRFKDILTVFQRNLHKSSIFRRKLAGGALGLDTPYWVEDPDFNLEFHVRHIALPKPGDWRQFCILLARLQARGLDMKRPLWEAYVIEGLDAVEGLPTNSFAIMLKVHHAAIDGVSGAEIVTAIHSLTPEGTPPEVPDNWQGESDPSPWQVWSKAYLHNLRRPVKFVSTVSRLVPAIMRANKQSEPDDGGLKAPTIHTRFNGRVDSSRVTDAIIMDLADIKRIRKACEGSTVNDVIIAIVGGGLRKYLRDKEELPQESLACSAPISMRKEHGSDSSGNQVSQMTISMATNLEDPLERLNAVHHSAGQSKAYSDALGTSVLMDVSEILIPQVLGWAMRTGLYAAASTSIPMPSHVVISNVPGPQQPLYLAGAKVHLMMGLGPLLHMMGLFHAVLSAAGRITINFVSCRSMLPDPEFYRECLQQSFDELMTAAAPAKKPAKRKRKPA
jgi:diacylglycerol O-acyltransferase / wax synthase